MNSNTIRLTPVAYVFNLIVMGLIAAATLWLITQLIGDGNYPLAGMLGAIVTFLCLVYLRPRFTPWRWLAVGMALA